MTWAESDHICCYSGIPYPRVYIARPGNHVRCVFTPLEPGIAMLLSVDQKHSTNFTSCPEESTGRRRIYNNRHIKS